MRFAPDQTSPSTPNCDHKIQVPFSPSPKTREDAPVRLHLHAGNASAAPVASNGPLCRLHPSLAPGPRRPCRHCLPFGIVSQPRRLLRFWYAVSAALLPANFACGFRRRPCGQDRGGPRHCGDLASTLAFKARHQVVFENSADRLLALPIALLLHSRSFFPNLFSFAGGAPPGLLEVLKFRSTNL